MPTNRNLRSVAAALLSVALTVLLLAACPAEDHELNASRPAGAVLPPGPREEVRLEAQALERARLAELAAQAKAEEGAWVVDLEAIERAMTPPTTRPAPPRVVEHAAPPRASRASAPARMDAAFWLRLSKGCECRTGDCANSGGYFQFKGSTARKVGYRPGMSYEEQRALAEKWLGMIGGNGGGSSGWPHCWWVALRG